MSGINEGLKVHEELTINKSTLCLTKLLGTKEFIQIQKCLFHAEEFIDRFGVVTPLKSSLKIQYSYMYNQFKGFERGYKPYHESQQTIADKLGYSLNTVKANISTLKAMGLIQVEVVAYNKYNTRVIGLEWLQGTLYNKAITEKREKKPFRYSYEEYKVVQKNYEQFNKIKDNLTIEHIVITKDEFLRLVKGKGV